MNITWRKEAGSLLDTVEKSRLEQVAQILQLKDCAAVDSYEMSADGPKLSSVFMFSSPYLVEIRMNSPRLEFDVISVFRLMNIRVEFQDIQVNASASPSVPVGTVEQIEGGAPSTAVMTQSAKTAGVLQCVTVTLRHTEQMASSLVYFGPDCDDWLTHVMRLNPKEHLMLAGPT